MTGKGFTVVPEFDSGFNGKGKGSGSACVGDVVDRIDSDKTEILCKDGGRSAVDGVVAKFTDDVQSVILNKEGVEEGIKSSIDDVNKDLLSVNPGTGSAVGAANLFLPAGRAGFPTAFSNKMTVRPCRYTDFRLNTSYNVTQSVVHRQEQNYTVPATVIEFSAPDTVVHPRHALLLEELIPEPPAAATSHDDSGLDLSQGECPCPSSWDN